MSTRQTSDWVQRMRAGTLELFDLKAFEKLQIADLSDQLCAAYPVRFLERHHRTKKEIGLAQSLTRSNRGSLCCCTIVCFLRVNLSK
jgi:hypothetical protein